MPTVRVCSEHTKTSLLSIFHAVTEETPGEPVQFICDIAQVSQASFAVDILRRKGHAIDTKFEFRETGIDKIIYTVNAVPSILDRIIKSTQDVESLYKTIEDRPNANVVRLHACGTAIARAYEFVVYCSARGWSFQKAELGSVPVTVATNDGHPRILWKTTSVISIVRTEN